MRQLTISGTHKVGFFFFFNEIITVFISTKNEDGQKMYSFFVFKLCFLDTENEN